MAKNTPLLSLAGQLLGSLRLLHGHSSSPYKFASDPLLGLSLHSLLPSQQKSTPWEIGTVRQATPYANCYLVQMPTGGGPIPCRSINSGSLGPIGVRGIGSIPINSRVAVLRSPNFGWGLILGTIPSLLNADQILNYFCSDAILPGSAVGYFNDDIYFGLQQWAGDASGIRDYSCGRPQDSLTGGEWGFLSETGIGIFVDSLQAFLRVDELCGLSLSYYDQYARLAGRNFDLWSSAFEVRSREDEGELLYYHGGAVYPWEALGALSPTGTPFQTNSPLETNPAILSTDLRDQSTIPFHRYREWGGYLGQGRKRMVCVPAPGDTYTQDGGPAAVGVFEENIALDGNYTLRTAAGCRIAKTLLIPVPHSRRLPEDQRGDSDGKAQNNYKESGYYGSATEHLVGQVDPGTDGNPLEKAAAGALDALSYETNWKGLHPFHYHAGDYQVPEENDNRSFTVESGAVDFSPLATQQNVDPPEPQTLAVDHRQPNAKYYALESFFEILEDGSIIIRNGHGAEIRLVGANVTIASPGDVNLRPGRNLLQWAGRDAILRARNSIDISASSKDVRIKAENNFQMLANTGGVLIEGRGAGTPDFQGKFGEDVIYGGVIIRAPVAPLISYSAGVYMRTGSESGSIGAGDIVLDASEGVNDIITRSGNFVRFLTAAEDYFGNSKVSAANTYSASGAQISGGIQVNGGAYILGSILTSGDIEAPRGSVSSSAGGQMGSYTNDPNALNQANQDIAQISQGFQAAIKAGNTESTAFQNSYYNDSEIGNDTVQSQVMFGFRDDPQQAQYNSANFVVVEDAWQQMVRLDGASGGMPWAEPAVDYQGTPTYPFPGNAQFQAQGGFVGLQQFTFRSNGHSKDRTDSAYQTATPTLAQWAQMSLNSDYRVCSAN